MSDFDDLIPQGQGGDFDDLIPKQPKAKQGRGKELAGRSVARGVMGTADLIGRGARMLPGMSMFDMALGKLPGLRDVGDAWLTQQGVAHPETAGERIASDVGEAVTGNALTMGAGALGNVRLLRANPVLQVAGTTAGTAAASSVREGGGSPMLQTAAGLAAGLSPAGVRYAVPAAIRGAVRGGEAGRAQMQQNIDNADLAGTSLSVGQASGRWLPQALESTLGRLPGSAGRMARFGADQNDAIGAGALRAAEELSPNPGRVNAGEAIIDGIRGPQGYDARKAAMLSRLYDRVEDTVGSDSPTAITNTLDVLRSQRAGIPGAPRTSARMRNGQLGSILDALEADASPASVFPGVAETPRVPFAALKGVRSEVGAKIGDAAYGNTDIPVRQLKPVYAAMSNDMDRAAVVQGPQAVAALARANKHAAAGARRTESIAPILKAGAPERVYDAAMRGGTRMDDLFKSLPQENRNAVAAAVIARLGKAKGGQQNANVDAFSNQTFLTNWGNLDDQARATLLRYLPTDSKKRLQAILSTSEAIRDGSRVLANPAGTAAAVTQGAGLGAVGLSAITGNLPTAAALVGAGGLANLLARGTTNNNIVRLLAKRTKVPAGGAIPLLLQSEEQRKRNQGKK